MGDVGRKGRMVLTGRRPCAAFYSFYLRPASRADNLICHILERPGRQIFFQKDMDWSYRADEKNWQPMNDESAWHCVEPDGEGLAGRKIYF